MEMICAIIYQLTKDLSMEEIKASGFDQYYVDHTLGLWPQAAGGVPFNACEFQVKGDAITDLTENMAAEQKARSTYDNILRLVNDPDVCAPIRFLREREIVHFQRFGEGLRLVQEHLDSRNFYAFNPEFDKCKDCNDTPATPAKTACGTTPIATAKASCGTTPTAPAKTACGCTPAASARKSCDCME